MGCDIHGFVEVKYSDDPNWHTFYKIPRVERNYNLFAKMAGVRNYNNIEPISSPRGIPEDASLVVKREVELWESDKHSLSWFTMDECVAIIEWEKQESGRSYIQDKFGYLFGDGFITKKEMDELDQKNKHKNIEDVRLVFWFDN